jgi:hypothetical protein
MAAELLAVAGRRLGLPDPESLVLPRIRRDRVWEERSVPLLERPPARDVTEYAPR